MSLLLVNRYFDTDTRDRRVSIYRFKISKVPLMDEGTIKTQNPKCRLHWCSIEFIDWRYSQSYWYFGPLLWTFAPLLSLWPPLPLPKVNVQYLQTVCGCGGGRVLSCVVDHILQKFLTRFRTFKIARPPQTKMTSKGDIQGLLSLTCLRPWSHSTPENRRHLSH